MPSLQIMRKSMLPFRRVPCRDFARACVLAALLTGWFCQKGRAHEVMLSTPATEEGDSYTTAVKRLDEILAYHLKRIGEMPSSWLNFEHASRTCLSRAQLTGDYRDYARAESLLTGAFAVAPEGAGPFLLRAQLNFSLHRMDRVEADLEREMGAILVSEDTRATAAGLKADLAFYRGQYKEAHSGYEGLLHSQRNPQDLVRLAEYHWQTGELDQAVNLLQETDASFRGLSAQFRAWLHLQRGSLELDRGRRDDALRLFYEAEKLFPGWWQVYGRMAQVLALQGKTGEALAVYQDLVAATGDPEFMDALAAILHSQADTALADQWNARARRVHEDRLQEFPEAAAGHALQHYLQSEKDPRKAVVLAERNRDLRPGGEATTLLAQAYLRAGRLSEARAAIERVLRTPWNTAKLHATASLIYAAGGDHEEARKERDRAEAINPHVMEELAWLTSSRPGGRGRDRRSPALPDEG